MTIPDAGRTPPTRPRHKRPVMAPDRSVPPHTWDGYGVATGGAPPGWARIADDRRALLPFANAVERPVQALRITLAPADAPDACWGLWDSARGTWRFLGPTRASLGIVLPGPLRLYEASGEYIARRVVVQVRDTA